MRVREAELPPDAGELAGLASDFDAEGLLCLLTEKVDAALLDACPSLRAVSNMAVGTDNIDLAECERRGIPVGNTPGVLTEATADLAFALLLACARRLVEAADAVRAGEWRTWEPGGWLGADVGGATLLIVGPGKIGAAVARRAEGFGMRVLEAGRDDELAPLLAEADYVSLHCPLTEATRGLIGAAELEAMKDSAYLINTARGEVVDQEALREALVAGHDRRRRPRRDDARAAARRRPAARRPQPHRPPPHRLGLAHDARGDGAARRREPDRRARRQADAAPGRAVAARELRARCGIHPDGMTTPAAIVRCDACHG